MIPITSLKNSSLNILTIVGHIFQSNSNVFGKKGVLKRWQFDGCTEVPWVWEMNIYFHVYFFRKISQFEDKKPNGAIGNDQTVYTY